LSNNEKIKYYNKLTKIKSNIQSIGSGWTHTIMLDDQNKVISRGRNNLGQLGKNYVEGNLCDEVKIPEKCQQIVAGTEFNFVISESGKLYGWGWNEHMNISSQNTI
jgi:alpha-tubulin suppressor-like RCC1 family protein